MKEHLMRSQQDADMNSLTGFTAAVAEQIENALLKGGAVPGKDYNILDLYKLAMPVVAQQWAIGEISFMRGHDAS